MVRKTTHLRQTAASTPLNDERTPRIRINRKIVTSFLLLLLLAVFTALAFFQSWSQLTHSLNLPFRIMLPGAWFNDDCFITFRYSKHLAEGLGFVWNSVHPVRVEGSTSLAWVFLNAAGIRLGVDPVPFSQWLSYLASIAGMVLIYWGGRRLVGLSPGWALLAPALLAAQRQWVVWGTCAMETRAATVAVLLATLTMAREQENRSLGWWASGMLFFLATLFRPEVPLLHAAAGLGVVLALRSRMALWSVIRSGLVHGAGLTLLVGIRLLYFGQPLPNTFYAKVGSLQLGDGLYYLWKFLLHTHGWLWLPLIAAGLLLTRKKRPLLWNMLLAQVALWTAWIVVLGGGRWEFRFFDFILPALALLVSCSLAAAGASTWFNRESVLRRSAIIALVTLAILSQASTSLTSCTYPLIFTANEMHQGARRMLWEGTVLAPYLTPEDRICTGWAGALPYTTGAWHFDPWGLNDPDAAGRSLDPDMPMFHQSYTHWLEIVDQQVMFCDIYNQFIFLSPYPSRGFLEEAPVTPWAEEGILVYSVKIRRKCFWIFASPRPVNEVESWVQSKGLRIQYASPLPGGVPGKFDYPSGRR